MSFLKSHIPFCILALLLVANIFVWSAVVRAQSDTLTVAFLDVGQGDSILIEAPSGNQMLIDGGEGKQVLRALSKVLSFYDRHIDIVAATHPDADHIGGLAYVLSRYDVDAYASNGQNADTAVFSAIKEAVEKEGAQTITLRAGHTIDLGDGVFVDVLFPYRDTSGWDRNDASLITRLRYGDTSVMLTGDASKSIEHYLTNIYGNAIASDVLKAGHHGSDTSSANTFLGFVSPNFGVISAGADNSYGHPDPEVLKRFQSFDIPTLSTADEKTIIFRSDGHSFTREH